MFILYSYIYGLAADGEVLWIALRICLTLLFTVVFIKIFRAVWRKIGEDTIYQKFIKNVLSTVIWITGIIFALSWLPQFTDFAGALLAGSGIAALAIGLAAQDSLSNAFNGLFISISKPFEVGDRVRLVNANITGFIEDITIRHTVVRTFTNSRIIIPNSVISRELIENSNFYNQQASSFIDIIITYDSDIEKAREIMARLISGHDDFIDTRAEETKETTPLVPVFVRNLGLYGVELRASMWTENVSSNFAACSDVRMCIIKEFKEAGIIIASSKFIDPMLNIKT